MEKKRLYELAIAGITAEMEKVERKIATAKRRIDDGEFHARQILMINQEELEGLAKELFALKTELFEVECNE